MEFKDVKYSLRDVDAEAGTFDGYGSVFGVVDSYGDIVEAGAFQRSLKANEHFPLLWSHDPTRPLGIIKAEEDSKGLKVRGELNMDLNEAHEKRSLIRQKAIRGMSIGYEAVKAPLVDGVRRLKEIKLWEISLVVFPANGKATVNNVKSMADLTSLLDSILTMDIKKIDEDKKELAIKAIERIKTLLEDDPPKSTQPIQDPSLEPLFAAVNQFCEQIKIN